MLTSGRDTARSVVWSFDATVGDSRTGSWVCDETNCCEPGNGCDRLPLHKLLRGPCCRRRPVELMTCMPVRLHTEHIPVWLPLLLPVMVDTIVLFKVGKVADDAVVLVVDCLAGCNRVFCTEVVRCATGDTAFSVCLSGFLDAAATGAAGRLTGMTGTANLRLDLRLFDSAHVAAVTTAGTTDGLLPAAGGGRCGNDARYS